MRVYKVSFVADQEQGRQLQWAGTQSDAAAMKKDIKAKHNVSAAVDQEEIPYDKAGMLAWLNDNVKSDTTA